MRYTIHLVATEDCDSIRDEVLAQAGAIEAAKAAASEHSSSGPYGVAIRDGETGLVDYGFGFGVAVPDPEND